MSASGVTFKYQKMKRILLLTDFSKSAEHAVDFAHDLFKGQHCVFHIMHVVKSSSYTTQQLMSSTSNSDVYSSLLKEAEEQLKAFQSALRSQHQNDLFEYEIHLDHDDFLEAVHQMVTKKQIDLVVLGSNGVSNIKEVLFGSHAIKAMRYLKADTLVIPQECSFQKEPKTMLLLDGFETLSPEQAQRIQHYVHKGSEGLHVLRVNVDDGEEQDVQSLFRSKVKWSQVNDVPAEYAAATYIQTHNIDHVVLLGPMESLWERLQGKQGKTNFVKLYQHPILIIR